MSSVQPLDRCRRAATLAGDDARVPRGQAPRNKGQRYPADPPTVEEIVAVMRQAQSSSLRSPSHRPDRRALARRAADQ